MTNSSAQKPSFSERSLTWIVELPRWARIGFSALFALAITLVVTPLIDRVYSENFFSMDTRMIPSLVSTGLGVIVYFAGWRLIVGYAGEAPTPRPAALWYFRIGVAACIMVVIMVIVGAIVGTTG